ACRALPGASGWQLGDRAPVRAGARPLELAELQRHPARALRPARGDAIHARRRRRPAPRNHVRAPRSCVQEWSRLAEFGIRAGPAHHPAALPPDDRGRASARCGCIEEGLRPMTDVALSPASTRKVFIRPDRGWFDFDLCAIWRYRELLVVL